MVLLKTLHQQVVSSVSKTRPVKLAESSTDRRQKDIIFTTLGFKTKSLFNDIPKNAKEANMLWVE